MRTVEFKGKIYELPQGVTMTKSGRFVARYAGKYLGNRSTPQEAHLLYAGEVQAKTGKPYREIALPEETKHEKLYEWRCANKNCKKGYGSKVMPEQCVCGSISFIGE